MFFLNLGAPGRRRGRLLLLRNARKTLALDAYGSRREDSLLALQQRTAAEFRLFTLFLQAPYTPMDQVRESQFARFTVAASIVARILGVSTDIVMAESNERHFIVNVVSCPVLST